MRAGRHLAAGHLHAFGFEEFSQEFGFQGPPSLCSPAYAHHLRKDKTIRSRAGAPAGRGTPRPDRFRHEEGFAGGKDSGRLESERRAQDHYFGLLATGARKTYSFDTLALGRS